MEEFNPIIEICAKIAGAADTIAGYERSIVQMQNHGEKELSDKFIEVQGSALEQLQKLTISLTGLIFPEQFVLEDSELDKADEGDGSVFMANELEHKKEPSFEIDYPEETKKNE